MIPVAWLGHNSDGTTYLSHRNTTRKNEKTPLYSGPQLELIGQFEKLRDAVLECEGVEMRDCYEVPKEAWEAVISLAVSSVMNEASNVKVRGCGDE